VGVLAGGDELLDAVEHELVAVASARVVIAEASEPVCGSVRQKQPSFSPRASGFSHSSFCASCRSFMVMPQASEFCTLTMVEVAPSPAAISSSVSTSDM
jgi:hypothetical protein